MTASSDSSGALDAAMAMLASGASVAAGWPGLGRRVDDVDGRARRFVPVHPGAGQFVDGLP
jgi:hypothetical protein